MHKAVLSLLMLAPLLAGCANESPGADPAVEDPGVQFQSDVLTLAQPTMPRDPPAAGERTLMEAPKWRLGEWWTYTMTDGFTDGTYEFTRVVAGEDRAAGNYLVGFPLEEFSNDVMLFHIPGFGDIAQSNLAFETHDKYFQMLDFPLQDGKSWQAEFEGTGLGTALVSTGGGQADVELITPNYHIQATYDPAIGEISEMVINNGTYATYKVTGHGYDYRGTVRVPHAHDLVFIHGRFGAVLNAGASGSGPVSTAITETVEVSPGYDRVSFIIAVGGGSQFLGAPTSVGVFRETVTAPDGTQYEASWTPADIPTDGDLKVIAIGHENPEGAWTLEHVAGGAGVAFVEGIGYHSIDVELPSGCVVASFNAQHHNANCKVSDGNIVAGNATTV
ncbi:MAG TPA: hypothetical protein VM327_01500 [Candidatus Thermoplasmatota archaeon]|nr:hypothetical protein [Candidatus Thermoplasmatota archaeon]